LLLIAPTDVDPRAVAGFLGFVLGLCEKAGRFHERKRIRIMEEAMSRSDRLRQFVSALHSSLDPRRTAYALANYGQELLGVYRCMAGTYDARGKFRMLSVSGLESVAVKSSFIRGIAAIAKQVCRNNKPLLVENPDAVHLAGEEGAEAEDLVTAGRVYMLQANSVILGVFPIRHEERVVGAFVVEKAKDIPIDLGERRQIEEFLVEAGSAFSNGLRYRNLPFSPLVRAMGALRDKVYRLSWGRRVVWSAVFLGLVLTPALVQRQVKVKGNAELVPVEARIAYVAQDGVIERLGSSYFSSDSFVDAGGLILKLRDGGGEQDRLSRYLWGRFTETGREELSQFATGGVDSISEEAVAALAEELNRILEGPCIYEGERFEGIQLNEDTRRLVQQYGGQKNAVSLNRWLLEEAYATEIKASESVTLTTGTVVKKGSVLAKLDTKGKEQEIGEVQSAIAETEILRNKAAIVGRKSEEKQLKSKLKELKARLKKLELDLQQHYITSPIDGTVITRDSILRLLLSKPTMRGEAIVEVVPQATPWQLTVNVPEDESGELLEAYHNLKAGESLTARVLLKAYPDTIFTSEVLSVAKKAYVETTGEQKYRNVIEVRVAEPKELRDQVDLRKGLQGKVAIECGRRSLYYTSTHEFIDFLRVSLF